MVQSEPISSKYWYSSSVKLWSNTLQINAIIWKEKRVIFLILIAAYLITSLLPTLQAGSTGLIINELINSSGSGRTSTLLLISISTLVFATALTPLLSTFIEYFQKLFWIFMEQKFELLLLQKNSQIDIARHEDPDYQILLHKVNNDGIYPVQNFIERQFFFAENILEFLIASVILINAQWWIFIVIFLATLPQLIVNVVYAESLWSIREAQGETKVKYYDLKTYFTQLPHLMEQKLYHSTDYLYGLAKKLFHGFQKEQIQSDKNKLFLQTFAVLISQLAIGFAIIFFILQVVYGKGQVGTLAFILISIDRFKTSLAGLFMNLGRHYKDSLAVSDILSVLDTTPIINNPATGIVLPPTKFPSISFQNVSFKYPQTQNYILRNFSLEIPAGQKLALVGINGAGKTTLTKLLCRFYDPTEGRILIDGQDLRELNLESWYYQLGVILQDYAHYHFLVKDAIAVGRVSFAPTETNISQAAVKSESDQFIQKWPEGFKQMLGKEFVHGIEPSIGQWQKLALARNFYREPRVLILDEPTSSLDAEAEAKIFDRLESLSHNQTLILISHRLSTVRRADQIVILDNGQIIEQGTHAELMALNGTYTKLFTIQAQGYLKP